MPYPLIALMTRPDSYLRWNSLFFVSISKVVLLGITASPVHGTNFGDGRHGDVVINQSTTVEELYASVRLPSDPAIYQASNPLAVLNFRSLRLTSGARLSASTWNGTSGGWVVCKVQRALVVEAGASISAFASGHAGGASYADGSGPGAGGKGYYNHPRPGDTYYRNGGGGGYGTAGGRGTGRDHEGDGWGGASYGEPTLQPRQMGSGGGGGEPAGGNGGGIVEIHAGSLQLDGTIDANGGGGNPGGDTSSGGGSGGSIFLHMVFGSVSNVTALGGSGVNGSGSGGVGRIRVEHCGTLTGTTSPAASISATPLDDEDGDGLTNVSEWGGNPLSPRNSDSDFMPDYLDPDSDGDTIPDGVEQGESAASPADSDADTIADYMDPDSDNDGIPDLIEAGPVGTIPVDSDSDEAPDYRDTDSDSDGVPDEVERGSDGDQPQDSEHDGKPDYRDPDSNNNGIPDSIELKPDGLPHPEDSDDDGLPDYWELFAGLNPAYPIDAQSYAPGGHFTWLQKYWADLNPLTNDTDLDGIEDHLELGVHGSSPLLVDSDKDGMPDDWEIVNQLDPRKDDSLEDRDFDLITNLIEYNGGVDSTKANSGDSDGDGVSDYSERNPGLNSWVSLYDRNNRLLGVRHARGSTFAQRYDGNGNLLRQAKLGLDSDGDGLSDLWEFAHGLDPKSAVGKDGSSGDGDGDGWSNLQEQAGGSSPTLAVEKPGANGCVVGNFSVPFTPTNFVSATGQLDFGGNEELVVAADGNPGGAENFIRVYSEVDSGWEFEPVTIGSYGVTSLAVGQLGSRSPAIYLGLRKPGGLGRVIELRKAGATWQTSVVAESLGESAVVHGVRVFGTEADLVLGLASRFGPDSALYRATVETNVWKLSMLEAGVSNRGPGMIVKSASSGVADRVLRLQDIGGIQIAEAKSHTSLDEFNATASGPFNPAIWTTTNQATEVGGLGRVEVSWASGQGTTVSSSAEAPLQWPNTASGLEFRLALGEHSQPTSSSFGGDATVNIGTTKIYGSGPNRGDTNVDIQVLRKDSLLFFRQKSNGGTWGAWASGPTGTYIRMEVSGRDVGSNSSFGSARLHLDYIRYRTPSQLLSAGSTLIDFTSSEAVYRSSTNSWYFKTSALPWMGAQLQAFAQGGKLATIDSSDLNVWLAAKFPGENWLGYYRNTSSSPWTWLNGSVSIYSSWAAGQPGTPADQVYAFSTTGTWSSATGGELKSGIVEVTSPSQDVAITVVNEPAASARLQWLSQSLANGRFNPSIATQTSAVQAFIDDKDASNSVTGADDFVLAEWVIDASPVQVRTLERRALADASLPSGYGLAAARTKEGTSDLLVTAENDGKVFAWLPPAGGGALARNLISVDHVGKAWHGLSRVSMGGGTDGIAGLRVTPSSPQTVDIVFWSPTELGFSAPPVIIQSPPSARIAATPSSGGAISPVNVTLWDSEGNPSRLTVQYQDPPGSGPWLDASLLTVAGQPAANQPSLGAPPTGQTHPITWNTLADLGSAFDSAVLLRTRATDTSGTGPWSEPMFYSVDLTNDTDSDGIPNDWELANGLNPEVQDSELDLDKDGLQNLIEFAIGSNPQSPANANMPTVFFGNAAGAPAAPGDTQYLTMTVTKNPAASTLNFEVEISSNLTTWQSGAESLTILEESATQLKVRAKSEVPAHPRRAMRLKVTSP